MHQIEAEEKRGALLGDPAVGVRRTRQAMRGQQTDAKRAHEEGSHKIERKRHGVRARRCDEPQTFAVRSERVFKNEGFPDARSFNLAVR